MPCRSVYLSFPCCCTPIISEWDNTSEHLMSSHWSPHSCPTVYQHLHHVGYPSASFLTFGCSVISSSSTVVIKWCIIHTIQSSIFKLVDFILYYHHKYWFQGTHKHFSPSPKTQKRGICTLWSIKSKAVYTWHNGVPSWKSWIDVQAHSGHLQICTGACKLCSHISTHLGA